MIISLLGASVYLSNENENPCLSCLLCMFIRIICCPRVQRGDLEATGCLKEMCVSV